MIALRNDLAHIRRLSSFVTAAVRNELDRRRLHAFVQELVDELGPSDEAEVARYSGMLAEIAAASRAIGEDRPHDRPLGRPSRFINAFRAWVMPGTGRPFSR